MREVQYPLAVSQVVEQNACEERGVGGMPKRVRDVAGPLLEGEGYVGTVPGEGCGAEDGAWKLEVDEGETGCDR